MENVIIYFSKDRPMQLDLTLYSHKQTCQDWNKQHKFVLYKYSDWQYHMGYVELIEEYEDVTFVKEINFKENLLDIISTIPYYYAVTFVVDDTIFTHSHSFDDIITSLEHEKDTIGFSLRLGENTKICYPLNAYNEYPSKIKTVSTSIRKSCWTGLQGDFGYPLEVSSSTYRLVDIISLLKQLKYHNPTLLEYSLSINKRLYAEKFPYLLSYNNSVAFSNPINKSFEENNNRSGSVSKYSTFSLNQLFRKGKRIDYNPFRVFTSTGCHQEVPISFIDKEG